MLQFGSASWSADSCSSVTSMFFMLSVLSEVRECSGEKSVKGLPST